MSQAQELFLGNLRKLSIKNKEAWKQFEKLGFASTKESYQYVRLGALQNRELELGRAYKGERAKPISFYIHVCGATGTVLDSKLPKGIYLVPYKQASLLYGSVIGPMIQKRIAQENDPYTCLNRALAPNPYVLYISPKVVIEEPIQIRSFSSSDKEILAYSQWMVVGGQSSETTWVFEGDHQGSFLWSHRLFDLHLEPNARLHFQLNGHCPAQQESVRAHLERRAFFKWSSLFAGDGFARQDFHIQLSGEEAEADLQGVALMAQKDQMHTHVLIEHKAENTRSNQKFKHVVAGEARCSFEGKIHVHPQAQQTEAYQLCNTLLLSEAARAYSKPNLEIFADDVKASHGATVGQVDEETLFYLTSRGISANVAKQLIIEGFLKEILLEMKGIHLSETWLADVIKNLLS
jgi:Fe-S cluster assembly protein SufD